MELGMSLGERLAIFGLPLGVGSYLIGLVGSAPTDAYGRGKERVYRAITVPLIVVGVAGLGLWALGY
jgi:hypothetical protein